MSQIILTKELLDEEIPKIKEQLSWARKNMLRCESGTPQREKWFDLMVHLGQQVVELREILKDAPSEIEDQNKG